MKIVEKNNVIIVIIAELYSYNINEIIISYETCFYKQIY